MAAKDRISDTESENSKMDLVSTPKKSSTEREPSQPLSVLSHRFRESPQKTYDQHERKSASADDSIAVLVPAPTRPWEYKKYRGDTTVDSVLDELEGPNGEVGYTIEYEDGKKANVSVEKLITLRNGQNALDLFNSLESEIKSTSSAEESIEEVVKDKMASVSGKRIRTKTNNADFVDISTTQLDSDEDELFADQNTVKKRRLDNKGRVSVLTSTRQSTRQGSKVSSRRTSPPQADASSGSDEDESRLKGRTVRAGIATRASTRVTRSTNNKPLVKLNLGSSLPAGEDDELIVAMPEESDGSEVKYQQTKNRRTRNSASKPQTRSKNSSRRAVVAESSSSSEAPQPTRRSGRERVIKSMRERDMDEEIYAEDTVKTAAPKVISIREIFQPVTKNSRFKAFHNSDCDVCLGNGTSSTKGPLIYCQGCSTSIHKNCLGYRSGREHMVTKVGQENFVMQCRRCIGVTAKKDSSAPRLDICQDCKEPGASCTAFSTRKTAKQEEKLREENDGDDPITEVSKDLVNNPDNLLFRCIRCQRGYHFEHLPPKKKPKGSPKDVSDTRDQRLKEYATKWQCKDCCDTSIKPQGLVAWRLIDRSKYHSHQTLDDFTEDQKEYLIKWEDQSYFKCSWMPGSWVWGVTAVAMRKAFARRDEGVNQKPKWTEEEAIPEEFYRMEIVFDVEYDDEFVPTSEKSDKAQISMVDSVLVKFQGLGYADAVWEDPPKPEEKERWTCFVAAYNEYVAGKYFKQPPASTMKERTDNFCSLNFARKIEVKKQPSALVGGQILGYQREGLNWLLYNFHQKKNVILADEMGLGKTIQIIAMIASLVKDNPKCWPFLVVTPNSTCPNWRREIKKWAPSLRVVAYYGVKKARDMAMKYELYPDGATDLRAHVVITSYEAPIDEQSKPFFRKIKWAGMVVDEGQRLKNDENLLYGALKSLKVPFQVLLTGTPLQNNKRELFNLLQFLDTSINAAKLDEEYEELTKENLPVLHELIRPFFLRRTKLQVLKDLPSLAQVILPVSMSVVQKKLYKSILAKNPQLIKSIFGHRQTELRPAERGNLNNILMQLRKCLCHPFLYSTAIEEINVSEEVLHRNLIDASAKFQLLEIMLPKLRERKHRVLLFSQFLNNLDLIEDFLKGLDLPFRRLDGTIGAQEKQKRIDEFNATDSDIFAFLLSTRSGGVGINLATADTVIIMDPDFNPQQDIQAISRAHRIGQKNKVLVFQLMTKDSAEEKIIQIGRKKIALGALIESMGQEDDAGVDLESILKHGTKALFEDDDRNDIRYDSASVDKLLDRTQVETTNMDEEKTTESQFSLARVWAADKDELTEDVGDPDIEADAPNFSVWDEILKQREEDAAREAAKNMQDFGRGKRARQMVNYEKPNMDVDDDVPSSAPIRRRSQESASDQEFGEALESDAEDNDSEPEAIDLKELESGKERRSSKAEDATALAMQERAHTLQERSTQTARKHQEGKFKVGSSQNKGQARSEQDQNRPQNANPPPGHPPTNQQQPTAHPQIQRPPLRQTFVPLPPRHQPPSNARPTHLQDVQGQAIIARPPLHVSRPPLYTQQPPSHTQPLSGGPRNGIPYPSIRPPVAGSPMCEKCGKTHIGIFSICPNLKDEGTIRLLIDRLENLKRENTPGEKRALWYLEIELRAMVAKNVAKARNSR
ncbi:PHD/FYVE-zinc-finger like domain-containing protein [Tricladium varicosporioides]|nr:PHD/FYVE-zinc-finger like domain-containing protein [Hymenoscyphus varicosporioides]